MALLRACRAGDQEAWERLICRYQRLIYTIPLRMGLGEDQAAKVFQQVCLTLLEHLDRIGQPDRIGARLATTARRASLLLLRREQLTVRFPADEGDDFEPEDHAPRPDALAERADCTTRCGARWQVSTRAAALDPPVASEPKRSAPFLGGEEGGVGSPVPERI